MEYLTGEREDEAKHWMHAAADMACRALCRSAKCGAVVVKDEEIIGAGYNAPPLDSEKHRMCDSQVGEGKPKYDRTCCMHAEWRAALDALWHHSDRIVGAKLYFTRVDDHGDILKSGRPFCTVCSRLALDLGLSHFLLWQEEGIAEFETGEYNRLSYEPWEG
ncbi:hypothetical protein JW899_01510 [Candidatus Uhrbacteria bacterium]|nr:hypothetical protein [Candidatus Uhrbacteria bacterium]